MSTSTVLPATVTMTDPPINVKPSQVGTIHEPLPARVSVGNNDGVTVTPGTVG